MAYSVRVVRRARQALAQLPEKIYTRVWAAVQALGMNPRPPGCVKLTNSPYWRIRVGEYRVLYTIDDAGHAVVVAVVAHRREAYR